MIIKKTHFIIILTSFLINSNLFSQDNDFKIKLEVKSAVYNKFPGFVYVFNNEKGDYENFMDLFCDDDIDVIDDELNLNNNNYGRLLKVGNYQKVLSARGFNLDDKDWCGMPLYIGEPNFINNDTGVIDIVAKHVLSFVENNVSLIDTQVLIITYSFKKTIKTEEERTFNSYSFKIRKIKLHPKYIRPKYVDFNQTVELTSFGVKIGPSTKVKFDSIKFNEYIIKKGDTLMNVSKIIPDYLKKQPQIIGYKDLDSCIFKREIDEDLLFEEITIPVKKKIGELGFSLFSNGGFTPFNTSNLIGLPFSNINQTITSYGFLLNGNLPLISRSFLNNNKLLSNNCNINYFTISFGVNSSILFLGINDYQESGLCRDIYDNTYERIAFLHSYTERQHTTWASLNLGYNLRIPINNAGGYFSLGLAGGANAMLRTQIKAEMDVTYSGIYDDFFKIKIAENGIMDYGNFKFSREKVIEYKFEIPNLIYNLKFYLGYGFKFFKSISSNIHLYCNSQLNYNNMNTTNSSFSLKYGEFKMLNDYTRFIVQRLIGLELSFTIKI